MLHPGALGDLLLAVPALRALRASAPEAELVLAAQGRVGELLAGLGAVDRHVPFDTLGLETLFGDDEVRPRLQALLRGARVVSWFGAADATFTRRLRGLAGETVVASSMPPAETAVWEHLLRSTGAPAGARCDAWRRPLAVPPALAAEGRRVVAATGATRPLVALHPGAGGTGKRWPAEAFAAVAAALSIRRDVAVAVHEGPTDHDAADLLRGRLAMPALSLAGLPLPTLAGVVARAALWIGNDSGVTHLAASVGAPTLALFVESNLAWRPWSSTARALAVEVTTSSRADVDRVIAAARDVLSLRAEVTP